MSLGIGKKIKLSEYQIIYEDSKFEIITETYNLGTATFQGWLRTDSKPVHCLMEIFHKIIQSISNFNFIVH